MNKTADNLFLTSPLLNQVPFILHGFGTRHCGERELRSLEPWNNLEPVELRQCHSDRIHIISRKPNAPLEGDAMISSLPGLLLIIKTADCLPVLMVDPQRKIIAAAHCGWRGTAARLLAKVVLTLIDVFGSQPLDLKVAFGPCISPQCYEVGEDVRQVFGQARFSLNEDLFRPHPEKAGRFLLDLRLANRTQLLAAGVKPENIEEIDICPHCQADFTSWRRDKNSAGRLLNFISLIPSL